MNGRRTGDAMMIEEYLPWSDYEKAWIAPGCRVIADRYEASQIAWKMRRIATATKFTEVQPETRAKAAYSADSMMNARHYKKVIRGC